MKNFKEILGRFRRHALDEYRQFINVFEARQLNHYTPEESELKWLFIATCPNSGSTALARYLLLAPKSAPLQKSAEGQWLAPSMSKGIHRFNASHHPDYESIKNIWVRRAQNRLPSGGLIVEKSPESTLRFKQIIDAFSKENIEIAILVRDPLSVCASWDSRYSIYHLNWSVNKNMFPINCSRDQKLTSIAKIIGEFYNRLSEIKSYSRAVINYENFCSNPQESIKALYQFYPGLMDINPHTKIKVKDYKDQIITNFNDRQVSKLNNKEIDIIMHELSNYRDSIRSFGYTNY